MSRPRVRQGWTWTCACGWTSSPTVSLDEALKMIQAHHVWHVDYAMGAIHTEAEPRYQTRPNVELRPLIGEP